jgi:hypothetical protein
VLHAGWPSGALNKESSCATAERGFASHGAFRSDTDSKYILSNSAAMDWAAPEMPAASDDEVCESARCIAKEDDVLLLIILIVLILGFGYGGYRVGPGWGYYGGGGISLILTIILILLLLKVI